jgi:hypothetical protein
VLAKISENLYRIERRCKEMEEGLKDSNAKLLIEMQLRIQEKAEYIEKVRGLELEVDLIRKANKDKEQEFTIIVNKLRKYEDLRELMLDEKFAKDCKKMLPIKQDDKDGIIKELSEELNHCRKISEEGKPEMDRKIATLTYALQNKQNYELLREELLVTHNPRKPQPPEPQKKPSPKKDRKPKPAQNINENTK